MLGFPLRWETTEQPLARVLCFPHSSLPGERLLPFPVTSALTPAPTSVVRGYHLLPTPLVTCANTRAHPHQWGQADLGPQPLHEVEQAAEMLLSTSHPAQPCAGCAAFCTAQPCGDEARVCGFWRGGCSTERTYGYRHWKDG